MLTVARADGWSAQVATGSLGTFRSGELLPGAYEVRAALPGFAERVAPAVAVRAGEEMRLDLTLDVAGLSETVSVVGEAPRATLEASELRETSAVDVGEALGWKAGLWRLRKGGIANDVVLRGLQSRDLNVLIDGQRVYGACPNHMDPAAFHVDFAEVDRVEVGKGPFDVKNQGGLGGTVNVVTRKPEPGWHATPTLAAGSFGLVNPSLTAGRGGRAARRVSPATRSAGATPTRMATAGASPSSPTTGPRTRATGPSRSAPRGAGSSGRPPRGTRWTSPTPARTRGPSSTPTS